jgi:hypothetical protein
MAFSSGFGMNRRGKSPRGTLALPANRVDLKRSDHQASFEFCRDRGAEGLQHRISAGTEHTAADTPTGRRRRRTARGLPPVRLLIMPPAVVAS